MLHYVNRSLSSHARALCCTCLFIQCLLLCVAWAAVSVYNMPFVHSFSASCIPSLSKCLRAGHGVSGDSGRYFLQNERMVYETFSCKTARSSPRMDSGDSGAVMRGEAEEWFCLRAWDSKPSITSSACNLHPALPIAFSLPSPTLLMWQALWGGTLPCLFTCLCRDNKRHYQHLTHPSLSLLCIIPPPSLVCVNSSVLHVKL